MGGVKVKTNQNRNDTLARARRRHEPEEVIPRWFFPQAIAVIQGPSPTPHPDRRLDQKSKPNISFNRV